jgi:hypothetical protein
LKGVDMVMRNYTVDYTVDGGKFQEFTLSSTVDMNAAQLKKAVTQGVRQIVNHSDVNWAVISASYDGEFVQIRQRKLKKPRKRIELESKLKKNRDYLRPTGQYQGHGWGRTGRTPLVVKAKDNK